jgi:hypothetical protein
MFVFDTHLYMFVWIGMRYIPSNGVPARSKCLGFGLVAFYYHDFANRIIVKIVFCL